MNTTDDTAPDKQRRSLRMDTRSEATEVSLELLGMARRHLDVLVYDYDEVLLPAAHIQTLLTRFMHEHERNQFRLLCSDTRYLHARGGALLEFARRFSTFIKLRQIPKEYRPANEQFIIADEHASLHQHDYTKTSYFASFNDRASARILHNRFEELWQRSTAVPGIHVTGL